MPEHDAFRRAILAEPAADVHRLVYADWLDETGDPANAALAEYVRVQCEADARPGIDRRRHELDQRATAIFLRNWQDWWRPVCRALDLPEPAAADRSLFGRVRRGVLGGKPVGWPYHASDTVGWNGVRRHYDPAVPWPLRAFAWARFRRGFVEDLDLSGDAGGGESDPSLTAWLGVVPVRTLRLTTRTASDFSAEDTPALRHLRTLHLEVADANNVATYLWSSNVTALEDLVLETQDEGTSAGEIAAVAATPAAPRLRRLQLDVADAAAMAAFAAAGRFSNLRELAMTVRVGEGETAEAGRCVTLLAETPTLTDLERFSLFAFEELSVDAFRALCRRPWPQLHALKLEDPLSPAHVRELVAADAFPHLRELTIAFAHDGIDESLAALARWPRLKQLTHLSSSYMLDRADPKALAAVAAVLDLDVVQTVQLWNVTESAAALLEQRLGDRLWVK